ncbi:MAG: tetratricopeptide repeat protein, partial [Thauera sp.]
MSSAPSAPAATAGEAPMSVDEALGHALRLHRAGYLDPAEKIYRAILGLCPDEAEVLHLLGMLRHARGDSAEASALIRRALALVPDAPGAWNNLGNVLLESGSVDDAIAAYRRCLELVPDFAEAHNNLGTIHRSRSEWSLAEEAYQ